MTHSHHNTPRTTRGAVAKPNSSAPNAHANATSLPVNNLPSVSKRTRYVNHLTLMFDVFLLNQAPMVIRHVEYLF